MGTPFTCSFTAQPEHIDVMGHVNNAVWVQWMEAVATAHWEAVAPADYVAAYLWVVTRHEIDYRGNVTLGEVVTAKTWVPEGPKGARFDRLIEFSGADGKVRVSSRTTWAMVDRATMRIMRVPPDVAAPFLL